MGFRLPDYARHFAGPAPPASSACAAGGGPPVQGRPACLGLHRRLPPRVRSSAPRRRPSRRSTAPT
eukprot:1938169-Pyramimonas_sp.AAC.1